MSNKSIRLIVIIVGIVVALLFLTVVPACSYNNKFVDLSQDVDQSWAEVQNTYQRRADLIPNLVNTVKGFAEHESNVLQGVTDARAGLKQAYDEAKAYDKVNVPQTAAEQEKYMQTQDRLGKALDVYVNAVHEAYPQLTSQPLYQDLMTQLEGTENRITTARQKYTVAVAEYNKAVLKFPGKMFAGMFGYAPREQFQADAAAQSVPKVDLTNSAPASTNDDF